MKSFIKNKRENNIAEHFNLDDHTNTSYTITIVGAEEDKNKLPKIRRSMDSSFRHYSTQRPESETIVK